MNLCNLVSQPVRAVYIVGIKHPVAVTTAYLAGGVLLGLVPYMLWAYRKIQKQAVSEQMVETTTSSMDSTDITPLVK